MLTFVALCTILSGGLISKFGFYVPILLAGSAITTIGTGLLYTLDIGTPSSHWIGYQALVGIGLGLSFQVPMIANQSFVKPSQISSVTAITLCKSMLTPSYAISCNMTLTPCFLQSSKQWAAPSSSQPLKALTPTDFFSASQFMPRVSTRLSSLLRVRRS